MSEDQASNRQVLRTTSILGGATAATIVIGLVRIKIFALLIGLAGIGLFGVFNNILMTGFLLAGLGIASSGLTQLAAVSDDDAAAARVRAAIWSLTWLLAIAGGAMMWVLREEIARLAAGGAQHAAAVGWLALALSGNVLSSGYYAVLQGYRRVGDLSRVKLYSALLAAVLGVAAVYASAYHGIVGALIATPLATILVAAFYSRRLPKWNWRSVSLPSLAAEWRPLVVLGFGFMLWTFMGSATQIAVRAMLVSHGGLEAAGLFQASWMISTNGQILILAAMLNDYLPRLSAIANDQPAVDRAVDQQLTISLLLAAPFIIAMIASAPLVLTILYSPQFTGASRLLQWQLAGDALKIAAWAIGFVLLARKDMLLFLLAEAILSAVYLGLLALLLPELGLEAAGIAYLAAYAVYLFVIAGICRWRHRISVSGSNMRLMALVLAAVVALVVVAGFSQTAALAAGAAAAAMMGVYALRRLGRMAGPMPGRLTALAARLRIR